MLGPIIHNRLVQKYLRILLGIYLLLSAFGKTINPSYFNDLIYNNVYGNQVFSQWVTIIIPLLEIFVGLLVLFNIVKYFYYFWIIVFIVFISLVVVYSWLKTGNQECGCMGAYIQLPLWGSLFKNIIIIGILWILFKNKTGGYISSVNLTWIFLTTLLISMVYVKFLTEEIASKNSISASAEAEFSDFKKSGFIDWIGLETEMIPLKYLKTTSWHKNKIGLFFFSPTCDHCKNATTNIVDIYNRHGLDSLVGFVPEATNIEDLADYKNQFSVPFKILTVKQDKYYEIVKKVPVLFIIENNILKKVYLSQNIPCNIVLQKLFL